MTVAFGFFRLNEIWVTHQSGITLIWGLTRGTSSLLLFPPIRALIITVPVGARESDPGTIERKIPPHHRYAGWAAAKMSPLLYKKMTHPSLSLAVFFFPVLLILILSMAKLARIEDRPTPPEVYSWRVYFNAFVATFAAVMIGCVSWSRPLAQVDRGGRYDSAFIGTSISLDSFKEEFGLNEKSATELNTINANIVSMYQAGCVLSQVIGLRVC